MIGGTAIGIGASSIFAILLAVLAVQDRNPSFRPSETWLPPLVIALTLGAGAVFAALAALARGERVRRWRVLGVPVGFTLACLGGLALVLRIEPLASSGDLALPVFRLAFVSASALVSFACTWLAARVFGEPHGLRTALRIAALTAVTYLLVALVLDPLPGFHVGGGSRAMPKVALTCNFLAGLLGGTLAFRALVRTTERK